jgi:hypothetical protein
MRTLAWFRGDKDKKQPVRDAEAQRKDRERQPDSFDVCQQSCQEIRTTPIRYLR